MLLCISAQVGGVSIGTALEVEDYNFTVQHIEKGDRLTRLFLESVDA